jgi:8-oxo-dGTP pyrophosphatase MutT (NUDIX family)
MGASAVLLRDERARILLVKPLYRDTWQLPGGIIERDESPRDAAQRETLEEIGLVIRPGRLLCVDYKAATVERPSCIQFVFDGGIASEEQLTSVVLEPNELALWRMVGTDEALSLVQPGGPASRLAQSLQSLKADTAAYLENGQPT